MRGQFDDPAKGVSSARDGTGTVEEGTLHVHDKQRGMPQNTAQEPSREFRWGVMIVAAPTTKLGG